MFDAVDEFPDVGVLGDRELAVTTFDGEIAGDECADEDDLLGVLADVDEAAGAGQTWAEFRDVERAVAIGLREAEKGDVEPAAVVEVELVGLIDDSLCIDAGAEIHAAGGNAADQARFGRQRDEIGDLFLVGDGRDALGHADAEIDDAVWLEFERCASCDDFSRAILHRRKRSRARAYLRGIGGIVLRGECLPVVFGLRHDDAIDEYARYLHLAWIERAAFGDTLDLRDDDAAGIARGHGDGERLQRQRFLLHCEITVGIAGRRADDADMDRERLVEEIFRAIDFHDAHDVLGRARIELAAAVARIDEGSEADARDVARPVRRNVTE